MLLDKLALSLKLSISVSVSLGEDGGRTSQIYTHRQYHVIHKVVYSL